MQKTLLNHSNYPKDFIIDKLDKTNLSLYYIRRAIFNALRQAMPHFQGDLVDIGCGIKPYKDYILDNNKEIKSYTGVDISGRDGIMPEILWDGTTLPVPDESYDCAMATEVLEHCFEPDVTLAEIYRVLKPGGTFFFTAPFQFYIHEAPYDAYRYTPFSMEKLLSKAGFREITIRGYGGHYGCFAHALGLFSTTPIYRKWKRFLFNQVKKYVFIPVMNMCIKREEIYSDFYRGEQIVGIYGIVKK